MRVLLAGFSGNMKCLHIIMPLHTTREELMIINKIDRDRI